MRVIYELDTINIVSAIINHFKLQNCKYKILFEYNLKYPTIFHQIGDEIPQEFSKI